MVFLAKRIPFSVYSIRQGHGQQSTTSAGQGMSNIVTLLGSRRRRQGLDRFSSSLLGG